MTNSLERIHGINMFSKEGWRRVHEECGHLRKPYEADDAELTDGAIEFARIWQEDNEEEFIDDETNEILTERFVDYILND